MHYFLLDGDLNFDTSGMRLCPNKACINELYSLKTFKMLKADC